MLYTPPLNGNLADPDRGWPNADPGAGLAGARVDGQAIERVQREIVAVITGAGIVPDNGDLTQLYQAISTLVTGGAGNKVAKAGDSMTGALIIALAALQLTLQNSDNTATLKDHLRLFRGSGAGTRASILSLGDAANGLSTIELQFLSAVDAVVKSFKFKNSGRLELGADPSLALEAATKQYVDAAVVIPAASTIISGISELATNTEMQAGTDTALVPSVASAASAMIGMGQTWQDVTGSRTAGTTYQNTTGKPIQVLITFSQQKYLQVSSNNVTWVNISLSQGGGAVPSGAVIPNNYYYRSEAAAGVLIWSELR